MGLNLALAASAAILAILGATSVSTAEVIQVKVEKLAFSPRQVSARVGDTIEWVNSDFILHSATAKNAGWDVNIPAGKSQILMLNQVGTIDYYCRFHPNMTGQITIAAN